MSEISLTNAGFDLFPNQLCVGTPPLAALNITSIDLFRVVISFAPPILVLVLPRNTIPVLTSWSGNSPRVELENG